MITAVYRPRNQDVLLIDQDSGASFPVPADDVPALVEALAEAFAVPQLAARLAGDPAAPVPARDLTGAL